MNKIINLIKLMLQGGLLVLLPLLLFILMMNEVIGLVVVLAKTSGACRCINSFKALNAGLIGADRTAGFKPARLVSDSEGATMIEITKWVLTIALLLCIPNLSGVAAAAEKAGELATVPHVDLNRYLGKWYEIASYPAWFQRDCTGSTAEYALMPDGRIRVTNRCYKSRLDGPVKESTGKAEVVDTATNARLKVWFFWPFKGDYWIIDLDPDYQWAVVGVPSRKYLWILSRTPTLDEAVYQGIIDRLIDQAYDPSRLQRTPQPPP